jgi:hypothetical protein
MGSSDFSQEANKKIIPNANAGIIGRSVAFISMYLFVDVKTRPAYPQARIDFFFRVIELKEILPFKEPICKKQLKNENLTPTVTAVIDFCKRQAVCLHIFLNYVHLKKRPGH